MKKILYTDFDGVINSYTSGFDKANPTNLPDPPVPGAIEFLTCAVEKFHVVIFTCRMLQPESEQAIHNWLLKHGLSNNVADQIAFSCTKRGADVYIDDRGFRFEGFFPTLEQLENMKPWNKQ